MNNLPGSWPRPPQLLVLVVFLLLTVFMSREVLIDEGLPVFLHEKQPAVWIKLGQGFARPGVHQYSDAQDVRDVIILTDTAGVIPFKGFEGCPDTLTGGEFLEVLQTSKKTTKIHCSWMPASHRVNLGIPLHPDRMNISDWQFLPGIGPVLANRIEKDRQENGDFESFRALRRVSGIGEKRLASWSEFF